MRQHRAESICVHSDSLGNDSARILLPSDMTCDQAINSILTLARKHVDAGCSCLTMDCSKISSVDSKLCAMLVAVYRESRRAGIACRCSDAPKSLIAWAAIFRLDFLIAGIVPQDVESHIPARRAAKLQTHGARDQTKRRFFHRAVNCLSFWNTTRSLGLFVRTSTP